MTKRAVLMARVSTDEQAEKGYSLPSQLEACRKYAEEHGFGVVAEITDDCSGAIPVAERPGGAKVYDMLRKGQADVVIQYTIDRTARDKRE
jgi:site-specific DNA recombinase